MTDLAKYDVDVPSFLNHDQLLELIAHADFNGDLRIDPDNLDEALIKQANIYAFYSGLLCKARLIFSEAEFDLDRVYANHLKIARQELESDSGSKRVTDKQLSAIIDTAPQILAAKQRLIRAEGQVTMLASYVKALDHKRECLMQLCNNRRKEMDSFSAPKSFSTSKSSNGPSPISE